MVEESTKGSLRWLKSRARKAEKIPALQKQEGGSHYKEDIIELAEFFYINDVPFPEQAIIKHVYRHRRKNGREDLLKAKHYIDMLLQWEYPEKEEEEEIENKSIDGTSTEDCSNLLQEPLTFTCQTCGKVFNHWGDREYHYCYCPPDHG